MVTVWLHYYGILLIVFVWWFSMVVVWVPYGSILFADCFCMFMCLWLLMVCMCDLMICLGAPYDWLLVFLWFLMNCLMVVLCLSYILSYGILLLSYWVTVVTYCWLCFYLSSYGVPIVSYGILWFYVCVIMVFLWLYYGCLMVCLLCCYGFFGCHWVSSGFLLCVDGPLVVSDCCYNSVVFVVWFLVCCCCIVAVWWYSYIFCWNVMFVLLLFSYGLYYGCFYGLIMVFVRFSCGLFRISVDVTIGSYGVLMAVLWFLMVVLWFS